jgi:hypothetical protein
VQCEWIVHKDADELLILQALFDTANVMAVFSEWSATVSVDDLLGLPCGPSAVSASSLHLTLPLLVLVLLLPGAAAGIVVVVLPTLSASVRMTRGPACMHPHLLLPASQHRSRTM